MRFIILFCAISFGCGTLQPMERQEPQVEQPAQADTDTRDVNDTATQIEQQTNELVRLARDARTAQNSADNRKPARVAEPVQQAVAQDETETDEEPAQAEPSRTGKPRTRTSKPRAERRIAITPPRSAPQIPCFLEPPTQIPQGDLVRIDNKMAHPIGLRIGGMSAAIIGTQVETGRTLPAGIALQPSLLPSGQSCWYAMRIPGQMQRLDAIMYRIDPYTERPTEISRTWKRFNIAYPRTYEYSVYFEPSTWNVH